MSLTLDQEALSPPPVLPLSGSPGAREEARGDHLAHAGQWKSLSWVWLTKWIRKTRRTRGVLSSPDRSELDGQIERVFSGQGRNLPHRKTVLDHIATLNATTPWLACS